MTTLTLDEFAKMLQASAKAVRPRLDADLAKIGALTVPLAAEMIGNEMSDWPPLAPATVAEKERLGYTGQVSATDPRLRTGADRDSIRAEVADLTLAVGSDRKIFRYQELGTQTTPPRPVLGPAMLGSLEFAAETLGETAVALLTPGAKLK